MPSVMLISLEFTKDSLHPQPIFLTLSEFQYFSLCTIVVTIVVLGKKLSPRSLRIYTSALKRCWKSSSSYPLILKIKTLYRRDVINGTTQDYINNDLIPSPLTSYYSSVFVLFIYNCLLLEEYESMNYTGHLSLGSRPL